MNALAGFGVVTGEVNAFDFHEIEQPRAVREFGHIASGPKWSLHFKTLGMRKYGLRGLWQLRGETD